MLPQVMYTRTDEQSKYRRGIRGIEEQRKDLSSKKRTNVHREGETVLSCDDLIWSSEEGVRVVSLYTASLACSSFNTGIQMMVRAKKKPLVGDSGSVANRRIAGRLKPCCRTMWEGSSHPFHSIIT